MTQDTTSAMRALRADTLNVDAGARLSARAPEMDYGAPAPEIMAASAFEGDPVVNAQGEHIGEIEEIMIDVRGGRVAYAVISVGGFLGIGDQYLAIPWRALTLDTDNDQFILDVDRERLKNAPAFDKEHWPPMSDRHWADQIHTYYRIRPYWER